MSKIIKLITLIACLFASTKVFADENILIRNRYDNIFAVYDAPDRIHLYYAERYTLNDITAYCIEPGIKITTNTYLATEDWSITNIAQEIRNDIRLIAYYGYDYPNHQTRNYYLATQELIWRKLAGREVYWVEGESIDSPRINIDKEKNEIINLVVNHAKAPSFDNQTIEVSFGKQNIIKDTNNVLSNYEIYSSDIDDVIINNNNLIINPNKPAKAGTIKLIKKNYTNSVALIYYSGSSQKLLKSGFLDPVVASSKVNITIKSKIKVTKVDDNNQIIKKSGFKFKIKNIDTNEYVCNLNNCIYETNSNGYFITELLDNGHYQLEEMENQAFYDYTWNNIPLAFTIDENSNITYENDEPIINIKFANKRAKGQLILKKVGEIANITNGSIIYEERGLINVKFKLYVNKDIYSITGELLRSKGYVEKTFTTNNSTYIINDLYLGEYCLEELSAPSSYLVDQTPICFTIEYKDKYTDKVVKEIKIKNYLKKSPVELIKIDSQTNNPISGVRIAIYASNGDLAYRGITDEDGKIYVASLPIGNYYYIELSAPEGYVIDTDMHYFEIKDNDTPITLIFANEPIKGTLEFVKFDYNTNAVLPNTTIEIYNENDELLYTETTNEEGKIIIENIPYGKYYLIEKIAPEGYQLDNSKYYFEIKDNNTIIKAVMTNERIIVPDTYLNDTNITYIISFVSIIGAAFLISRKRIVLKIIGFIIISGGVALSVYQNTRIVISTKEIKAATLNYINNTSHLKTKETVNDIKPIYNYIAVLEIPAINLKQGLVNKYSKYNDIKYNIQIISESSMPNITNTNLILAAHNGNSEAAYFNDLHRLKESDEVYIYYNGNKYIYEINKHYEVIKTGYIDIERAKNINAITLITCKDDTYQLVYIGYLKNIQSY